jgi:hypothetical protein
VLFWDNFVMNIRIWDGLDYLSMYTAIYSDDRPTVLPSLYHFYELRKGRKWNAGSERKLIYQCCQRGTGVHIKTEGTQTVVVIALSLSIYILYRAGGTC